MNAADQAALLLRQVDIPTTTLLLWLADCTNNADGAPTIPERVRWMQERDGIVQLLQERRVRWFRAWRWSRISRIAWAGARARKLEQ